VTDLYLLEPDPSITWYPFGDCRPVAELRAGVWLIRERWEAIANGEATAIFGPPHLRQFSEDGVPPVCERSPVAGPAVIGHSRFAPTGTAPEWPTGPARLMNDGMPVGWWVPAGATWEGDFPNAPEVELEGMVLTGSYDLISALEHFLVADVTDFTHERGDPIPDGSIVIGDPGDVVLLGARVEPGVVFDVRKGPIVLEQHTYIKSGARLEGPLYVGPGSEIFGEHVGHSAIGPRCKVRGEVAETVFLGYSNKAHTGFLGHSVVGRWVNLGALTTTSDLKNTYGPVRVVVGDERVETGQQFLGTMFGDHAKTAIGTMLNTGAVIGTGANVFGFDQAPKYVPPFAWGPDGHMSREGFIAVAERVMPRRQVEFTAAVRASLEATYDHAAG
jgi:UDP-N-acetylglucosamine diphosphorylase/glucosamine-1-phosphate N-acetyltransferase